MKLVALLDLAGEIKRNPTRFARALAGRYLALLFEKPSLRTRLTFELAIKQLGGDAITSTGLIAEREPIKDVARNLDRWTNGIVARTFMQRTVDELAQWSDVPVINALSDHVPSLPGAGGYADRAGAVWQVPRPQDRVRRRRQQRGALADDLRHAAGNGFRHRDAARVMSRMPRSSRSAKELAAGTGAEVTVTHDAARSSTRRARRVYGRLGQHGPGARSHRAARASFHAYQVNDALLARPRPDAVFMHCLPAKRGQEVTDGVMESPRSVVFDQAENRLHAQKALLLMLLGSATHVASPALLTRLYNEIENE